ncbi:RNA polymerase sigma-70 factor [Pedobacter insulae]|uniref:RNA polymerase sigma-70 factor, ECF subfamily n=1 Tax=Pedobacter insulae TaxID=414048 RepID=A0A1I2TWE4_9SPHI|nr:RNA polymerase sigma-70 factor [Pedobacter insulae]SFG67707.1 RNA polymerase sigma-70 factor, ECF subfamily [Pedobacter insulae]
MVNEDITITRFEDFFHMHYRFLCLVSVQLVGDLDVAKDLVQEFYIDFWKRRQTIQLTSTFQSYAVRAVKNLSVSYLRKQQSNASRNIHLLKDDGFDPMADIESQYEMEALDSKVKTAIDKLPKECKRIFMLHNIDNLSYAQIAERNNISINTVKTQMKRAYAFLRTELSDQSLSWLIISAYLLAN